MYISQIFILSSRGDKLVFKGYREDVADDTYEVFFRKYNFWDGKLGQAPRGDCPPFFTEKGVQYAFLRRRRLLFVCTTCENASPNTLAELLLRLEQLLKDYLGVVTEESVRKNFTLVYELLDEMVQFGIVQETDTDRLRPFVSNAVVSVVQAETLMDRLRRGEFDDRSKRSDEAATSVLSVDAAKKNEVYVDLLERLTMVFGARGNVVSTAVEGALMLKSFLPGTPTITVGLSKEIVLRGSLPRGQAPPPGSIILDGVTFDNGVDTSQFVRSRQVTLRPSLGEVSVLRYRCIAPTAMPPFRLAQSLDVQSACRGVILLRVRAELPADTTALAVRICVPLPAMTVGAVADFLSEGATHSYEWKEAKRELCWTIQKFSGGVEHQAQVRFTTAEEITPAVRREVGPVALFFEIPQFSMSGTRVLSLQIDERGTSQNPGKWIRCITQANAYIFRSH
ncbi:putative mu-adaptin 4 putative adaptor complex AP-4 medium subunit [Leptomonas seymouri]|uniref:Putative mu-adaptin 4 putative adaptor complex AP-4 medium subunit n=1 Tax=Leptomonas seymouri TaxID=5684 RepID=A0A0N1PAY6_LEPSE|nr:putative mu-adaptin 4 putative adaptor complex AP-4 medium subunit [Leptomonas seymouri]|eukprot:KPI84362.1 putative mu-adaptin 4 putative adaptor complex AP-4 medium subunit [Leptomonas seymouri]